MNQQSMRLLACAGLLVLLMPAAGTHAQPAQKPPAQPPAQGQQPAGQGQPGQGQSGQGQSGQPAAGQDGVLSGNPDTGDIDEILQGEEEVLSGNGFSYDPGNRRDPFKSLLAGPERTEIRGPRPEGIPGLLIDEIDLKGIWRTGKGYVAQVVATNQKKTFLLKEGDQLYDGDVVSISRGEVVFKQIVPDQTALKPFREVVKSLNPST